MKAYPLIDYNSFKYDTEPIFDKENEIVHSSSLSDARYVVENILKLPYERFLNEEVFMNFYRKRLSYNNIYVFYDGIHSNMGVSVFISGNGCLVYSQYHTMIGLIKRVLRRGDCSFTRLDLACDDKVGILDVTKIHKEIDDECLRSRFMKFPFVGDTKKKVTKIQTQYLGSKRGSDVYFRIYDKAEEQGYDGVWNRIEGVFKHEHANEVAKLLVENYENFGECVAEIINGQIQFINKDDSNISRCSVADWWLDFIETIKKSQYTLPSKPKSKVESIYNFMQTLSCLIYVLESAYGFNVYRQLYKDGEARSGDRHRKIIADFKALYRDTAISGA